MLAKAKMPSAGRSDILLDKLSLTITREMNDELLLVTLFFGFFLLLASLVCVCTRRVLPSPKAGAEPRDKGPSLVDVPRPSSLLMPPSVEYLPSPDCSCMLELVPPNDKVVSESPL